MDITVEKEQESGTSILSGLDTIVKWLEEDVDEELFQQYKQILEAETDEDRLEIAKRILPDDKYGLPSLVLARATTDNAKKQEYYENALKLTSDLKNDGATTAFIFGYSTLECAELLWTHDQPDQAIRLLEAADVDNLHYAQDLIDAIRFAAVTYLICQNQDERARIVLDGEAVPSMEWHYMNGLLRFRELGDTFISRGAIAYAFGEDEEFADMLADTEYDTRQIFDLESKDNRNSRYIKTTREAWNKSPQAMDWLLSTRKQGRPKVGLAETVDAVRLRRVENEFESALKHLKRMDHRAAKRCLNSALREADRLNDGGAKFHVVLKSLVLLFGDLGDSIQPLNAHLEKRITFIESQNATPEALMHSYCEIASSYLDYFSDIKNAEKYAKKAFDLLTTTVREKTDSLTEVNILTILMSAAIINGDFEAIESACRSKLTLQDASLGPEHLNAIDDLQYLRHALHRLNKHEEELEIAERVYAIDINGDKDPDYDDLDWCDKIKSEW